MNFLSCIGLIILGISYLIGCICLTKDIILMLVPAIKCRNIRNCKKDDCPFRELCTHIAYSDKEKSDMLERIRNLN